MPSTVAKTETQESSETQALRPEPGLGVKCAFCATQHFLECERFAGCS